MKFPKIFTFRNLCILGFIVILGLTLKSTSAIKYTGEQELCIKNVSGNVTCLSEGESLTLDDDSTYYMTLNAESQPKTIISAVDYLEILFTSLILGVVLILGTYTVIKTIIQ